MSGHLFWPRGHFVPIITFGRGFLVELPSRSSWLSQETLKILPSDGVIFYTDGSLCEGRAGAGVFSDIRESYALGSFATVFQTEIYAISACSDYCRSANMHNTTLLALSSYTISSKLLYQCGLSMQVFSNNNRMRLFWVLGHCDIKGNEEADRLARMGSDSHFCGPEPCFPLSASIVRDMNKKWVIDAHSKDWIALNSCRQSKLWIKHPKLKTTTYLMCLPKKQLRILVSLITGHCCLIKHFHRMGLITSPVGASCQLKEETALPFVCVFPTFATLRTHIFGKLILNASEFREASASTILRFTFQSGRLETNLD
jgi:hypothetical protein